MAPAVSKKPSVAAPKKPRTTKPKVKHVALNFGTVEVSTSQRSKSATPRFTLETPPSSQDVCTKPLTNGKSVKATTKGKERAVDVEADGQLWVDKYAPQVQAELAVHKRKIQEVQRWLEEALDGGKLKKYRRLLVLTGPAGTGKTATARVLLKEMGVEVLEWGGAQEERFAGDDYPESLSHKFSLFLSHATHGLSFGPFNQFTSKSPSKRILLLEDLPNILHPATRAAFQSALEAYVADAMAPPVILIISESGARGAEGWRRDERWDIRSILPPNLLSSPYVTEVQFNPVAPTIMHSALSRILLQTHPSSQSLKPSPETLDIIVESSMGDMRSAVMALQFACRIDLPEAVAGGGTAKGRGRKKKVKAGEEVRRLIEGVTRNEQVLALFHVLGKILYNKRFGDDPDENEDPELEASIRGTMPLPPHLAPFARRPSKVDPNALYADSPVDIPMLSLYCHQNFTQFCNTIDELESAIEWISYSESFSLDPERVAPTLPEYVSHLLTRGILISLPSPVPRRGQKMLKSAFWDWSRKERDSADALRAWAGENVDAAREGAGNIAVVERAWVLSRTMGEEKCGRKLEKVLSVGKLTWVSPASQGGYGSQLLEEGDEGYGEELGMSQSQTTWKATREDEEIDSEEGGWLEEDDIEED